LPRSFTRKRDSAACSAEMRTPANNQAPVAIKARVSVFGQFCQ
jgi:hypothetical protein